MPRERTYTKSGYVEVQWAKDGRLVCIVSAELNDGELTSEHMHQFIEDEDLRPVLATLRRAKRQAFRDQGATINVGLPDPGIETFDDQVRRARRLTDGRA